MKMKTQHIKSHEWKLLSCVQLCDPVNYTVHGILQARIQEWVAFPFSIGSSQPRGRSEVCCITDGFLPAEPQEKTKNTGVGSLSLFQGIFPTQESNRGLLHCRQIPYQLSYLGSPFHQTSLPSDTAHQHSNTTGSPRSTTTFLITNERPNFKYFPLSSYYTLSLSSSEILRNSKLPHGGNWPPPSGTDSLGGDTVGEMGISRFFCLQLITYC